MHLLRRAGFLMPKLYFKLFLSKKRSKHFYYTPFNFLYFNPPLHQTEIYQVSGSSLGAGKQASKAAQSLWASLLLTLSTARACARQQFQHITFCNNLTVLQIEHSYNIKVTQESKPSKRPPPFTTTNVYLVYINSHVKEHHRR